MKEQD